MKVRHAHLFSALAALLTIALPLSATERPSRLSQPLSPSQNVIIENTNITTGEFWDAYTSDNVDQRRRAELFLLGVLDATEGLSWCDYRSFKTITIDEVIFSQLKKAAGDVRAERAAKSIGRILTQKFPCGRKQ